MSKKGAIATVKARPAATWADAGKIFESFLGDRAEGTRRAYISDLGDLAGFLAADSPGAALETILKAGPQGAFKLVTDYKAELGTRGLAPATVNRRLASLRSFIKFANAAGLVAWTLGVKNVKAETYRDTRGPGAAGVQLMLTALRGRTNKKAIRDRAIIRLLYDLSLRRAEVAALDLADVDLDRPAVKIKGKGRREKESRTLAEPTAEVLRLWLAVRGDAPGPVFTNFDRAGKGKRLTGTAIYYLVTGLGELAGIKVTPHGLRHAGITESLDRSGGDIRAAQKYSRHRKLDTLLIYDDTRRDLAGEMARKVAASVTT